MAYELSKEGNSEAGLIFVVNRPPSFNAVWLLFIYFKDMEDLS